MSAHIGEGIFWILNGPNGLAISPTEEIKKSGVPYIRNSWALDGDLRGKMMGLGHLTVSREIYEAMELYRKNGGYCDLTLSGYLTKIVGRPG